MIKVTPNENLVHCTRDRFVNGAPTNDLIHNVLLARKLIRIANHYFCLRPGAIYSGYIDENPHGFFTLKLWQGDDVVRIFVIGNLGYAGALHVDVSDETMVTFDLLVAAASDRNSQPSLIAA